MIVGFGPMRSSIQPKAKAPMPAKTFIAMAKIRISSKSMPKVTPT